MKKLILVLGGARSGKSSYAVELAKEFKKKVVFIATAASCDEEMAKRIALHRNSRPKQWKLVEEGRDISAILPALKDRYEVVLIDCLGLLVSNLLADDLTDDEIEKRIKKLVEAILKIDVTTIVVSNEVGSGIVPMNALARRFRDLLGLSNQMIAKKADEVIFMRAGIPVRIKD
ncbi:MAG: bifunctional adenosylcobinamide kinase/adenosylcobinamide-phosphate guanylyltransferase [Candidatus Omnitrophota bacterium]